MSDPEYLMRDWLADWVLAHGTMDSLGEWVAPFAWDARDARIRLYREEGVMNIIVHQLPDRYDVRELRDDPNHWMNRCAADFYGVQSVSARLKGSP